MSIIGGLTGFLAVHYYLAYLFLFLGSFFETLIGPGFFIYGEFIFLAGAILGGTGVLNIWLVALACITGGFLGDSASYFIGIKYGKGFVSHFLHKKNKYLTLKNYTKAKIFFQRHGKKSIFFARLLGPLSWITPFLAGTLHVKYKDFLKYNIPGVIVGIGEFMIVGYLFGFSYNLFLPKIEKYILYILIALIIVIVIYKFSKIDGYKKRKS